MDFFTNYNQLCKAAGKSANGVAKELGVASSSVTQWKRGSTPRPATIEMIAEYFGVTPEELLFGIKKEPSIPTDEELSKNDAMWEKREEISRMLPDLTSQQLSDIINYIENTNNPELNARYSELLKIASMMSSEKYQTVMALLKELL